ncbi:MAG: hypothetical protein RLZ77_1168 [Bacteroidota bacterium]|jgi:hypothetical protein
MKKYFLLLISLSIGVAYSQKNKTITENEKITTITRTTSAYEDIEISGSFDVKLISGQEGNLTIKGDENVLEYIITEVKNGRLAVYFDKNKSIRYNYNSSIEITIPVEEIKQLDISGSGNFKNNDLIKTENLFLKINGSGNVTFNAETKNLKIAKSGSGNLDGKGTSNNIEINSAGSGNVNLSDLKSENAVVSLSGSGNIKVNCSINLNAQTIGSGNIRYSGNPTNTKLKTEGSGRISE